MWARSCSGHSHPLWPQRCCANQPPQEVSCQRTFPDPWPWAFWIPLGSFPKPLCRYWSFPKPLCPWLCPWSFPKPLCPWLCPLSFPKPGCPWPFPKPLVPSQFWYLLLLFLLLLGLFQNLFCRGEDCSPGPLLAQTPLVASNVLSKDFCFLEGGLLLKLGLQFSPALSFKCVFCIAGVSLPHGTPLLAGPVFPPFFSFPWTKGSPLLVLGTIWLFQTCCRTTTRSHAGLFQTFSTALTFPSKCLFQNLAKAQLFPKLEKPGSFPKPRAKQKTKGATTKACLRCYFSARCRMLADIVVCLLR